MSVVRFLSRSEVSWTHNRDHIHCLPVFSIFFAMDCQNPYGYSELSELLELSGEGIPVRDFKGRMVQWIAEYLFFSEGVAK